MPDLPRTAFALLVAASLGRPHFADAGEPIDLSRLPANPIATLVSLPLQYNHDVGIGRDGRGSRDTLNVQPVFPIGLGGDWNLISRSVVPVIHHRTASGSTIRGVGDATQSFFLSPAAPTRAGWTWGVGPVLRLPTASDDRLGFGQWGAGPTAVALKKTGNGWIVGALANHVWSISGDSHRPPISMSFVQPFVSRGFAGGRSLSANIESTYDWRRQHWLVPVNVLVGQMIPLHDKRVNLQAGVRYHAASRALGPDWGVRVMVTLLFDES
ncbi:hypothetical protein [Pseudoxanthomonas indica]|uniref:MetA-pathway of phenol degradation n=1 Tax=Pseudoxanthomonas indica TaxID=428993 RepID=A0A1T5LPP7_9GAMM|nr:hypothetical protein [Pseudoxanthomonas indica]GGD37772.1 hypothetical protein GCM10007235_07490 [Pseudoxanthomonas indica]SKC77920.1 hypothetical protein SAMN06296058_2871 [Pseudoxanthomonas indica]